MRLQDGAARTGGHPCRAPVPGAPVPGTPGLGKLSDPDQVPTSLSLYLTPESDLFNEAPKLYDFSDPEIQNLMPRGAGTPPNTEMPASTQSPFLSPGPCHPKKGVIPILYQALSGTRKVCLPT